MDVRTDVLSYGVTYDFRTPYYNFDVAARKEVKNQILKKLRMSEQTFWKRLRGDYKIIKESELRVWREFLKVQDIKAVGLGTGTGISGLHL